MTELTVPHRAFLNASAIADELLQDVDSYAGGIQFTLTGPTGRTITQRRPDRPAGDAKYLTEAGVPLVLPVPQAFDYPHRLLRTTAPIVVVEGTKQHLAAASALSGSRERYAVIGVLGCTAWMHDGGRPLPDLYEIDWHGRDVYLALDADIKTNPAVWDAAKSLSDVLTIELGAKSVKFVQITGAPTDGFDDVLARAPQDRRQDVAERLVANAQAKLPRRPRNRNRYIGGDGLLVDDLFRAIEADFPLAALNDQSIAIYAGGRYWNGTSLKFEAEVSTRLGNAYRPAHFDAVKAHAVPLLVAQGKQVPARQERVLLNVRNGLLDPTSLKLYEHTPEWRSTVQFNVDWDPDAECPLYDEWIEQRVGQDQIPGLEQMTSLCLDPTTVPMRSLFLFGPTRTGKSTYARLMKEIVGPENCSSVRLHDMEKDFAIAEMYGKVLNLGADLPAGHIKELSIFKQTTGGDTLDANRKYGKKFQFVNHALSVFTANEISTIGEMSGAYFDRIHPVYFGNSYAGSMDPEIEERLLAERNGIFRRWVLATQARLAQKGGLPMPPPVWVMTQFEQESDLVRRFLAEETVADDTIEPTHLYNAYKRWCEDMGRRALGRNKFLGRVAEAGFPSRKTNNRRVHDLRLRRDDDPLPDDGPPSQDRDVRDGSITEVSAPNEVGPSASFLREAVSGTNVPNATAPCSDCTTMAFDLETGDADRLFLYPKDTHYIRLLVVACEHGSWVTSDRGQMREWLSREVTWVGHNAHQFDVLVLRRYLGIDLLDRTIDTLPLARLVLPPLPAPQAKKRSRPKPIQYGLAQLADRFGLPGKAGDLGALAQTHGQGSSDKYLAIPVDDAEYLAYAHGDGTATWRLYKYLDAHLPDRTYAEREMRLSRMAAEMRWRGLGVDGATLEARLEEDQAERVNVANRLREAGIEVDKKVTKAGKIVAAKLLGGDFPSGPDGTPLLNQDTLAGLEHELVPDLLAMNADRGLPVLVSKNLADDGRVHAAMDMSNQASGRWSVKQPGLTTWGKRGSGGRDRALFAARPGHVLMSCDLTSIDIVGMAALSQDPDMLARLRRGDWHREMADLLFCDRSDEARTKAKAAAHAINYNAGPVTLAQTAGIDEADAGAIIASIKESFPTLDLFKRERVHQAETLGTFSNGWGRALNTHAGEEYTGAPGLSGQSWARDAAMECLLRLDDVGLSQYVVLHIHDEFIFEVPQEQEPELRPKIVDAMTFTRDGAPVSCSLSPAAKTWDQLM